MDLFLIAAQTAEDGGGTSINLALVALVVLAVVALVVHLRRGRSR